MLIAPLLKIRPGITALIGGGGKTTLMYTLARELRERGTVIVCTSTRIRVPELCDVLTDADAGAVRDALAERGVVCAGTPAEPGKLAAPALPFEALAGIADFVIVEADGSRGLPMKAHLPHEPVIPENTGNTVLVVGSDGFGQPIREACHRPALYAALAGTDEGAPVTPETEAAVIAAEGFGDRIFINKADSGAAMENARVLAGLVPVPVIAGSLWEGRYECLC